MQTKPSGWDDLFSTSHKTEYKFIINGIEYSGSDIQSTPIITKAFADRLTIGKCCSGTLRLDVRKKSDIPKSAPVAAYCRLSSADGNIKTDWIEQGYYYISSRSVNRSITSIFCRDKMSKARSSYWDKPQ